MIGAFNNNIDNDDQVETEQSANVVESNEDSDPVIADSNQESDEEPVQKQEPVVVDVKNVQESDEDQKEEEKEDKEPEYHEEYESMASEEKELMKELVPKNLLENLFWNLDVNHNGQIDIGDLEILFEESANITLTSVTDKMKFDDPDNIEIDEIAQMLSTFHETELKKVLSNRRLKFVKSFHTQINNGDIFALYRVFDALNIDRRHLLTDDFKNIQGKRSTSDLTTGELEKILMALDRKSLLKLLALKHVELEAGLWSWSTVFKILKIGDLVFYFMCLMVMLDQLGRTDIKDVSCSQMAAIFQGYMIIKGLGYLFEGCLVSCSCLFKHPKQLETRYLMSFFPFLSWATIVCFRHIAVFMALVEWGTTSSSCWDEVTDEAEPLAAFFFWAMCYEAVFFCIACAAWVILPCITAYLLSIAVSPPEDVGAAARKQKHEPLTLYVQSKFHHTIKEGDSFFEFFVHFTGLRYIIKKADFARLLVGTSTEQALSSKDVMMWSKRDVFQWLGSIGMGKYAHMFFDDGITGNLLLTHVDPTLLVRGYRIPDTDAQLIWSRLNDLRKPTTVGAWSVSEVTDWLCRIGMAQYVDDFRNARVDGPSLLAHSENLVMVLDQIAEFHRIKLLDEMKVLRNEGAPVTLKSHHLNPWGQPLAIQGGYTAQAQQAQFMAHQQQAQAQQAQFTGAETNLDDLTEFDEHTPNFANLADVDASQAV